MHCVWKGIQNLQHESRPHGRPFGRQNISGKKPLLPSPTSVSNIPFQPAQCTLCDKKLQTRTSYRNHVKRHTEEKKHSCEHCGKKFFTKFHVKLHTSKMHTKGKAKAPKVESNVVQVEYGLRIADSTDDEQIISSYV